MAQCCNGTQLFGLKAASEALESARDCLSLRSAAMQRRATLGAELGFCAVDTEVARYVYSPLQIVQQASAFTA